MENGFEVHDYIAALSAWQKPNCGSKIIGPLTDNSGFHCSCASASLMTVLPYRRCQLLPLPCTLPMAYDLKNLHWACGSLHLFTMVDGFCNCLTATCCAEHQFSWIRRLKVEGRPGHISKSKASRTQLSKCCPEVAPGAVKVCLSFGQRSVASALLQTLGANPQSPRRLGEFCFRQAWWQIHELRKQINPDCRHNPISSVIEVATKCCTY